MSKYYKSEFGRKDRKELVRIGKALKTLSEEDIEYILNPNTTENEARRRMTTARQRSGYYAFA